MTAPHTSATKFAVRAISEGLRAEDPPSIRSTIIPPGAVDILRGRHHERTMQDCPRHRGLERHRLRYRQALLARGWNVMGNARTQARLDATAAQLDTGERFFGVAGDIAATAKRTEDSPRRRCLR